MVEKSGNAATVFFHSLECHLPPLPSSIPADVQENIGEKDAAQKNIKMNYRSIK
jgi:hypothetical protein